MADQNKEETSPPDGQESRSESHGTALVTPDRKTTPAKREPGRLPPYKVLLHNDDKNTFEHVVRSILGLTHLPETEAVQKTLEAHETGLSLLVVTHKERAELYQEQFASLSLTVTIEPDV
ncbi:MAG: ATP-dependent Clp protease adaptor ClpS [Planctomycetota bacterium]